MLIAAIVLITAALVLSTAGVWSERRSGVLRPAASALTALMAVTGAVALVLMAVHLAWAIVVLWKGSDAARRVFHRFSLGVWAVWLVPYVTGMVGALIR